MLVLKDRETMNSKEFLEFFLKLSYLSPAIMLLIHDLGEKRSKELLLCVVFRDAGLSF